jgi:hypothetical protein
MRRTAGLVLVGAGVFLLVLTLMLKVYAEPRIVRAPLDQATGTSSVSDGNSRVLDRGTLTVREGLTLTARREVVGLREAAEASGRADVAVWKTGNTVLGPDKETISVTRETVAFDRRTGQAVACCGEELNGDTAVKHEGLLFKFPFETAKQDYPFWDSTAKKASTARFVGEETRQGLTTYHFVHEVPETELSTVQVPPSLVGRTGDQLIPATTVYTNTRELWVEPVSGIIVYGKETPKQVLRGDDGAELLTVFDANIGYTPQTEKERADDARSSGGSVFLIRNVLPSVTLVAGVLSLIGGLLLLFVLGGARRRDTAPAVVDVRDRTAGAVPAGPADQDRPRST